jgi:UDP-N-acetylglucosamine diphosphorylase/glucosamine-1-phosphate N-acetyltransferase
MSSSRQSAAVILAAGKGTRMKDPTIAKVMYQILGKPMIHYVADLALALGMNRVIVVVGYQKEAVTEYLKASHSSAVCVVQEEQLGTGHAVMQARNALDGFQGHVIVLSGDVPLLTKESVNALIAYHLETGARATILTAVMEDPTGYGRIVRHNDGTVGKVVEHRDASAEEIKIREINSGIYVFEKTSLFEGLEHINADNVQQEYYLTDIFEYFVKRQWKVSGLKVNHINEIRGINTYEQLEEARKLMEDRVAARASK